MLSMKNLVKKVVDKNPKRRGLNNLIGEAGI